MQHESEEATKLIIWAAIREHTSQFGLYNDEIEEFIEEIKESLKPEIFTNKVFHETKV